MHHPKHDTPPRWLLSFFRWFCHPDYREDIEGDLIERFHKVKSKEGINKARLYFLKEVLLLLRPGIINYKLNLYSMSMIKIIAVNLLVVLMIIAPFLPGHSNKLVIGLSVLGQFAGFLGLALVPVGIAWAFMRTKQFIPAIIALTISTAIYLLLVLAAFGNDGIVTALIALLAGLYAFTKAVKGIRRLRVSDGQFRVMPYYLITIPLIALCARMFLISPLSDFSRSYAIKNSEALISRVEAYRSMMGQYPESLQQLQSRYSEKIPGPAVMGILGFRYNKIDDRYSISFSQWLDFGSLEEIVLYDKHNLRNDLKGIYAEYDYSFDLCRIKGAFANYSAGVDHWRYYLAD